MAHPGIAGRETGFPFIREMHTMRIHSMHIFGGCIARRSGGCTCMAYRILCLYLVYWFGGYFMEQPA